MKVKVRSIPFGSQTRTDALLVLHLVGESYPREMSRLLNAPLSGVQRALASLEKDGLIAARAAGRTRLYRLDPRYFARQTLNDYLERLAATEDRLRVSANALRRRPRRTGKPL